MRKLALCTALVLTCAAGTAHAQISGDIVRVGVLNDISGIFQDTNGMGSVEAARMAAEDFNGGAKNIKVEIVYADHQNKADVGSASRANGRRHGVDAIVDVRIRPSASAINSLVRDSKMTFWRRRPQLRPHRQGLLAQHHSMGQRRLGDREHHRVGDDGARWRDCTSSRSTTRSARASRPRPPATSKHGGRCWAPAARSALPISPPSCCRRRIQGQGDRARQCGGDTINAVKGREFGIQQSSQTMVAFLLFVNDVHGMGRRSRGPADPRILLLGHGRRHSRLRQTLCGAARHEWQDAERQPGWRRFHARYLNAVAHRQRCGPGRRAANEEIQGQGQAVRRRHHPPTAASSTRCLFEVKKPDESSILTTITS